MTTLKPLIGAAMLMAASAVSSLAANKLTWFPENSDGPGVIGQRYIEAGFGLTDVEHTSHNVYGGGISGNVPILTGLDLSGGFRHSWYDRDIYSYDTLNFGGSLIHYVQIEDGIKPFIAASLGYVFREEKLSPGWVFASNNQSSRDEDWGTWGFTVGAEFAYKWISVIPSISYQDDFRRKSKSSQSFVYNVEVNSWVTRQIGIFAGVAYIDAQHTDLRTFGVDVGARFRF